MTLPSTRGGIGPGAGTGVFMTTRPSRALKPTEVSSLPGASAFVRLALVP